MKKLTLITLGVAGLMLASCQHDSDSVGGGSGNIPKLRVSMQDMSSGQTRATVAPEGDEEVVNSLYLLFFEPSANRSGEYKGYYPVAAPLLMNTDIELANLTTHSLDPSTAYKILAVANLDIHASYLGSESISEWLTGLEGKTESNVYNLTRAYLTASAPVDGGAILMTGEADKSADPTATIPLTLTRGLVRFDVVNNAKNDYDLVDVSIWNAFPETSIFGGGVLDYSNTTRIRKLCQVDNDSSYPDIYGGLYSFPNQVANPGEKDAKTTCLIVGLFNHSTSKLTYHRVNINAAESMQDLKRNNAYRLTILSVAGDGADTQDEAYAGGVNNLNYRINFWNLDDDGLIKQNGDIILAIPTKRVKFGAEADERTYDIFTFGGAAGEQIAISTDFEGTAGNFITVTKSGNTITVKAQALTNSTDEREGLITITYGGLSATMAIYQSGTAGQFLRVTTPGGVSIPAFSTLSGVVMSGVIGVEASGSWTAKVYCLGSTSYFGIVSGTPTTTLHQSTLLTDNFQIQTTEANSETSPRQAFVLISLDSDETNYNTALVLTQRAQGGVVLNPPITQLNWNALGELTGVTGEDAYSYKIQVEPSYDGTIYAAWTPSIISGNSAFSIISGYYDPNSLSGNYVIVKANGLNLGATQNGVLRIQLDGNGPSTDVALTQNHFTVGITPSITEISVKGGETSELSVVVTGAPDSSLRWTAVISTACEVGPLDRHTATLLDTTGSPLSTGDGYMHNLSEKFKVSFPKLYYGNHKKGNVTATVVLKLWSGTTEILSHTFPVTQKKLEPKNVNIANYHGEYYTYGSLYFTTAFYNKPMRDMLISLFGTSGTDIEPYSSGGTPPVVSKVYSPNNLIGGTANALVSARATATTISTDITYVHASLFNTLTSYETSIDTWRAGDYGVLLCTADIAVAADYASFFYPLRNLGWKSAGNANDNNAKVLRNATNSKITDFIFNKGPFGVVNPDGVTVKFTGAANNPWYSDTSSQSVNISGVTTGAVAILGTDGRASIVIDPKYRIVFLGEGNFFATDVGYPGALYGLIDAGFTTDKSILLANIMAYVVLTAQYGSHFSDLLVD